MGPLDAIGQGNPALKAMMDSLQNYKPDNIPTPEDRQGALDKYVGAVQTAGVDTRQPWEAQLEGMSTSDNPFDPFIAGRAGLKYLEKWNETQRESAAQRAVKAAQLEYQDILQRRKDAQALLLGKSKASTRGFEFRKNADGTTTAFDRTTGAPVGTYGPQDIGKIANLTQTLAKVAFDKGEYETLDAAMEWAQGVAVRVIGGMNTTVGNRTAPLAGQEGGLPVVQPPAPGMPQLSAPMEEAPGLRLNESTLPPEQQATVERLIERLKANPDNADLRKNTIAQLLTIQNQVAPQAAPSTLPKLDVQKQEEKKGYGHKAGEQMAVLSSDIQKTGAAAQSLSGDLNMMQSMYQKYGDQIPEGEQANLVASMKSSLKTFGVEVEGVGATDVLKALGTKQALKARTADGENLLPGAISNYEDQLLQKMSPTLTMSKEGRLLMIQVMQAQLAMRTKLAEAARGYISKNKRLDEGWYNVAADIAKTNPFLDPRRIAAIDAYTKTLLKGVE